MRRSSRGHPLVYQNNPGDTSVLTVELYEKWYGLHLVHVGGRIEEINFPMHEDAEEADPNISPPFVDHVPNPLAVLHMAKRLGYLVDPNSLEMMIGRWETEVLDHYEEKPAP